MSFWYGLAQAKKDADARNHDKEMLQMKFDHDIDMLNRKVAASAAGYRGGGTRSGGGYRRGGGNSPSEKDLDQIAYAVSTGMDPGVMWDLFTKNQHTYVYDTLDKADPSDRGYLSDQFNKAVIDQRDVNDFGDAEVGLGPMIEATRGSDPSTPEGLDDFVIAANIPSAPISDPESPVNNSPSIPTPENDMDPLGQPPAFYNFANVRPEDRVETSALRNESYELMVTLFNLDMMKEDNGAIRYIPREGSENDVINAKLASHMFSRRINETLSAPGNTLSTDALIDQEYERLAALRKESESSTDFFDKLQNYYNSTGLDEKPSTEPVGGATEVVAPVNTPPPELSDVAPEVPTEAPAPLSSPSMGESNNVKLTPNSVPRTYDKVDLADPSLTVEDVLRMNVDSALTDIVDNTSGLDTASSGVSFEDSPMALPQDTAEKLKIGAFPIGVRNGIITPQEIMQVPLNGFAVDREGTLYRKVLNNRGQPVLQRVQ